MLDYHRLISGDKYFTSATDRVTATTTSLTTTVMEALKQVFETKKQQVGCSGEFQTLALTIENLGNCGIGYFRYSWLPYGQ